MPIRIYLNVIEDSKTVKLETTLDQSSPGSIIKLGGLWTPQQTSLEDIDLICCNHNQSGYDKKIEVNECPGSGNNDVEYTQDSDTTGSVIRFT